jgi:AcrR family transcriptional regulator
MVPPAPAKTRNAATTREAILLAARHRFSRESYDNVGLREIAGDAGIDPALVARYFGSKEQLFKEAVQGDGKDLMLGISRDELPDYFASLALSHTGDDALATATKIECLLMLLRSASSPKAAEIIRDAINENVLCPTASLLGEEDSGVRASLCLAVLMGVSVLKSALSVPALCAADETALRARLIRLFAASIDD